MSSFLMRPHPRSNILDVFSERDSIDRTPVYQRISGVWNLHKRQLLIDSIINGVDLPKLYFRELIPPRTIDGSRVRYAVIDGKQRLEAIWSFIENEFPLADEFQFFDDPAVKAGGTSFSELARRFPRLRARFDGTELPIVTVQTEDEELIENLFSRLNEAVPLTAPEYRNTLGGPLPRLFRELATHGFFQDRLPFETGRHRYLDLAAKFSYITSQDDFVSTKKGTLDQFVRHYRTGRERNEGWAGQAAVRKLDEAVRFNLAAMESFFHPNDGLLGGIGWVTLYFHIFRVVKGAPPRRLQRSHFEDFVNALSETRGRIRAISLGETRGTRIDSDLAAFDRLRQAPNDGSALRTRYEILRKRLLEREGVRLPAVSK